MGPPSKTLRSISQVAFDEVVMENMEDLGMEPAEALQDAIDTLTLQGVDRSGIVTCVPGEATNNPLLQCLDSLKKLDSGDLDGEAAEMSGLFNKLANLLSEETANPAIAVKNGGVQLVCSLCSKLPTGSHQALAPGFTALALMLHGMSSMY